MHTLFSIRIPMLAGLLLLPGFAFAQFGDLDTFVGDFGSFINDVLIPVIITLAGLVFVIGAVRFFLLAGDEYDDNKKKGKALMLYGIIAFVLIVSVWGIVRLFADGLGFDNSQLNNPPEAPTSL